MLLRSFFTSEKNRTANENAYSLLHSENTIFIPAVYLAEISISIAYAILIEISAR